MKDWRACTLLLNSTILGYYTGDELARGFEKLPENKYPWIPASQACNETT